MKQTIFKNIHGYEFLTKRPIATRFEIYEDNGGGLYLCVFDIDGVCIRIFENFEYQDGPSLQEALMLLSEDETSYEQWDGDLAERIGSTAGALYEEGLGTLIVDNDGVWLSQLGVAGAKALGISDDAWKMSPDEEESL